MTLLFRPPRPLTMNPDLVIPDDFKREPETLGKVLDDIVAIDDRERAALDAENKRACEAAR